MHSLHHNPPGPIPETADDDGAGYGRWGAHDVVGGQAVVIEGALDRHNVFWARPLFYRSIYHHMPTTPPLYNNVDGRYMLGSA